MIIIFINNTSSLSSFNSNNSIRVWDLFLDNSINLPPHSISPNSLQSGNNDDVLTSENGIVLWKPSGGGNLEIFDTSFTLSGTLFKVDVVPTGNLRFIKNGLNLYMIFVTPTIVPNEDLNSIGLCNLTTSLPIPSDFINPIQYIMPLRVKEPESPSLSSSAGITFFNNTTMYTYNPRSTTRTWNVTSGDFQIFSQIYSYIKI